MDLVLLVSSWFYTQRLSQQVASQPGTSRPTPGKDPGTIVHTLASNYRSQVGFNQNRCMEIVVTKFPGFLVVFTKHKDGFGVVGLELLFYAEGFSAGCFSTRHSSTHPWEGPWNSSSHLGFKLSFILWVQPQPMHGDSGNQIFRLSSCVH